MHLLSNIAILGIHVSFRGSNINGGMKYCEFSPLFVEDFQFDYIFQLGWNHQLEYYSPNKIITASITRPNLAAYLRQTLATRLGSTSNMAWTKNRWVKGWFSYGPVGPKNRY